MFSDRRELQVLEEVIQKNKSEIMELEIAKRDLEAELARKWELLTAQIQRAREYGDRIADEIFVIESDSGNFWTGVSWTGDLSEVQYFTRDELPTEFNKCILEKNEHDDPINWGYHRIGDEDAKFFIVRAFKAGGGVRLDRS
jgi:hypothetical protein